MSISHVIFYLFRIIFTFQCSLPAVLTIITQDSERLLYNTKGDRKITHTIYKNFKNREYLQETSYIYEKKINIR